MPSVKAKHPREIPVGFYKPIGQLIVRWGFTELYLQSIIWHVWKIKDVKVARALTWNLNAVGKVELFGALAWRWIIDPALRSELKQIYGEAERLRAARNRFAHGVWGYVPGKRKEMRLFNLRKLDRRIAPRASRPTIAEVRQLAADISTLNVRLQRFHRALGAPTP